MSRQVNMTRVYDCTLYCRVVQDKGCLFAHVLIRYLVYAFDYGPTFYLRHIAVIIAFETTLLYVHIDVDTFNLNRIAQLSIY